MKGLYFVTEDSAEALSGFRPYGAGWRQCSKVEHDRVRKEAARRKLRELIAPKATLTVVGVNDAGTQHKVFVPQTMSDGSVAIRDVTGWVIEACGFRRARGRQAITQGGYGYSKTFEIGYALGLALWPDGTPEPHGVRNGEPDSNGGYALGVNAH